MTIDTVRHSQDLLMEKWEFVTTKWDVKKIAHFTGRVFSVLNPGRYSRFLAIFHKNIEPKIRDFDAFSKQLVRGLHIFERMQKPSDSTHETLQRIHELDSTEIPFRETLPYWKNFKTESLARLLHMEVVRRPSSQTYKILQAARERKNCPEESRVIDSSTLKWIFRYLTAQNEEKTPLLTISCYLWEEAVNPNINLELRFEVRGYLLDPNHMKPFLNQLEKFPLPLPKISPFLKSPKLPNDFKKRLSKNCFLAAYNLWRNSGQKEILLFLENIYFYIQDDSDLDTPDSKLQQTFFLFLIDSVHTMENSHRTRLAHSFLKPHQKRVNCKQFFQMARDRTGGFGQTPDAWISSIEENFLKSINS